MLVSPLSLRAGTLRELINKVGNGIVNPGTPGPVPLTVALWDGRKIQARYYYGTDKPDISTPNSFIWNDRKIKDALQALLDEGKPFIVQTGTHDMVCRLIWEVMPSDEQM